MNGRGSNILWRGSKVNVQTKVKPWEHKPKLADDDPTVSQIDIEKLKTIKTRLTKPNFLKIQYLCCYVNKVISKMYFRAVEIQYVLLLMENQEDLNPSANM